MKDRITVRMSPDLIARIDEWIGERPGYVSRQEAVRRLLAFALDHNCPFVADDMGQSSNALELASERSQRQPS